MKLLKRITSAFIAALSLALLFCSCSKKEEQNYTGITSEYWLPTSYVRKTAGGEEECSIQYSYDKDGMFSYAGCHMGKDVLDSKVKTTYDKENGKMDICLNDRITYTIEINENNNYCLNLHGKEVLDYDDSHFEKFMMLNSDGSLKKLDEKPGYSATAEMQSNGSVLLKETRFELTSETVLVPVSKDAMIEFIALNKLYGVSPDYWYCLEVAQ